MIGQQAYLLPKWRVYLTEENKRFVVNQKVKLVSPYELKRWLVSVDEDQVQRFLFADDNDFSRWMRGVFGAEAVADELMGSKSKWQTVVRLERAMARELNLPAWVGMLWLTPREKGFYLGGEMIKGLKELGKAMRKLSEDELELIEDVGLSSIAGWIRYEVGDYWLAEKVKKTEDPSGVRELVLERISELETIVI